MTLDEMIQHLEALALVIPTFNPENHPHRDIIAALRAGQQMRNALERWDDTPGVKAWDAAVGGKE